MATTAREAQGMTPVLSANAWGETSKNTAHTAVISSAGMSVTT